jgi:hypothetical protein
MKTIKLPRQRGARSGEGYNADATAKLPIKYLSFDDVTRIYAITKGRLYPILKENPELSITLVEPGRSRGRRLILAAKLEAYLERLEQEQKNRAPGKLKQEIVQ